MNLVLSFIRPSKPAKTVGPFHAVHLDGETVREAQNRTLVARHREHQWLVDGERYFRLDATTRVQIHFERPPQGTYSRQFGPYERFSAVDGIAYTDDRVFAFVDPKVGDWFCYNDGQHWPIMVVSDASATGRRERLRSLAALAPLVGGVIGLWNAGRLLYLGRTGSIRDLLADLARGRAGCSLEEVTSVTWDVHEDPIRREAELLAEYQAAARTLMETYGRFQGSLARTFSLVQISKAARCAAQETRAQARRTRQTLAATGATQALATA